MIAVKVLVSLIMVLAFLIISLPYSEISQWELLDNKLHTLLKQGIYQVHEEDYNNAITTFKKVIEFHPNYPMGYFLVAAVYQTIMRNYRTNVYDNEFEKFINLAINIGNKAIKQDRENALNYFYLGGAYGYRGLHKVRERNWIGAFFDGRDGMHNLKIALEKDPELYDVYYGLGTFHYWLGAKSKVIRFLFSYKGDRQQGIDEIEKAIVKGRYTIIECQYALIYIYYEEKNYQKAFLVNQELYEQFPLNPACLYIRARIYEQQEKWEEAKNTMQKLLHHLLASEYTSVGYEVECHYRIASYDYKIGDIISARNECLQALALENHRNPSKELEGPLEDFKQILKEAKQLYAELNELK